MNQRAFNALMDMAVGMVLLGIAVAILYYGLGCEPVTAAVCSYFVLNKLSTR